MTISSTTPRIQYVAAASQTVFTVPFKFFEDTDLKVYVTQSGSDPDDSGQLKTLTSHYTVAGAGEDAGGTITLTSGATAGDIVTIVRDIPEERTTDLVSGGDLFARTLNESLERFIAMVQEANSKIDLALKMPESISDSVSPVLPAPVGDTYLKWNSAGNGIVLVPPSSDLADASSVTYTPSGSGAVAGTVQAKLREIVTPMDFGAAGDGSTDDSAAIQAAIDWIRSNYNSTVRNYPAVLDLANKAYKVGTSIDATMFRSPGFEMRNGTMFGTCTGKIVLDLAGSNDFTLQNIKIVGDTTNTPAVGIYFGRCLISGSYPATASAKLFGCRTNGRFSKAAVVNFASEVSNQVGCFYLNTSRSLTAYTYVNVFRADTLDDYIGGLTSDYQTLPTAATGGHSNTLHNMDTCQIQRHSEVVLPIVSISKANPALVTVDVDALAASGIANGDMLFFTNIGGMTELNYNNYEVANLNAVAGTFTLVGVDSTAYGTFTSGTIRNQTGPAILLSGTQRMTLKTSYVLAYGNTPFVVDMEDGPIRSCDFDCHCEPNPRRIVDLRYTGGSYSAVQGFKLDLLNANQVIVDEVVGITGGGKVRIDNPIIEIASMSAAPANKIFHPPADFILRDADINVPLEAALNDPDDFAEFSGQTYAPDTQRKKYYGVGHLFMKSISQALDKVGIRWNGSRYVSWDNETGVERALVHNEVQAASSFNNIAAAVNTYGKYQGKFVFDATTSKPVFATGSTAAAAWVYADGTTAYTPS